MAENWAAWERERLNGIDGFSERLNGVHHEVTPNILRHRDGVCPYQMGRVLAAQGKVRT